LNEIIAIAVLKENGGFFTVFQRKMNQTALRTFIS